MKTKMSHVIITIIIAIAICFTVADSNVLSVNAFVPEATEAHVVTESIESVQHNVVCKDLNVVGSMRALDSDEKVIPLKVGVATQEIEPVKNFVTSSPDITFAYDYVESDVMPYILFTPSTAETNEKTPLIISLHGMGERGTSAENFKNKFISKMLLNWELEGFNAYVMIPHLTGAGYADKWNAPYAAEKLFTVIDQFIEEHNIDTDRIIIQGQSMGGYGCLYMAAYHPEYFSAVVPVSAYNSNADLTKLSNVAFKAYVGTSANGEDSGSVKFVMGKLVDTFGAENVNQRPCSHNQIPIVAFTEDLNEDGKSDLIEWMLSQTKSDANTQED